MNMKKLFIFLFLFCCAPSEKDRVIARDIVSLSSCVAFNRSVNCRVLLGLGGGQRVVMREHVMPGDEVCLTEISNGCQTWTEWELCK